MKRLTLHHSQVLEVVFLAAAYIASTIHRLSPAQHDFGSLSHLTTLSICGPSRAGTGFLHRTLVRVSILPALTVLKCSRVADSYPPHWELDIIESVIGTPLTYESFSIRAPLKDIRFTDCKISPRSLWKFVRHFSKTVQSVYYDDTCQTEADVDQNTRFYTYRYYDWHSNDNPGHYCETLEERPRGELKKFGFTIVKGRDAGGKSWLRLEKQIAQHFDPDMNNYGPVV